MAAGPTIRRTDIDPVATYNALGPLTLAEVVRLSKMTYYHRNRWLANIYGQATRPFALAQYWRILAVEEARTARIIKRRAEAEIVRQGQRDVGQKVEV